jgi:2-polyprenyl-3-methyl-5-hydroxy-6-metoxy-1,4-benzoquinol methylase
MADALTCQACGATYPVVRGIPRFVSDEHYAGNFGLQWNRHRRTQLDSHTGLPLSRDRLFAASAWPDRLEGETVLEVGSGAGRFTEVLASTGADVISCDLSDAVEANLANNGDKPNVQIVQANIAELPLPEHSVDKVVCLGVIQHTPAPEAFFKELVKYVKPGGQLVIDCYSARLRTVLCWKYLLRPITTRMKPETLYRIVERVTPSLLPVGLFLYRWLGAVGYRLLPVHTHAHVGLPPHLLKDWAVLDTFDMYSPAHDHPRTAPQVERWFREAGFVDVTVEYGLNGVVGRGTLAQASSSTSQ